MQFRVQQNEKLTSFDAKTGLQPSATRHFLVTSRLSMFKV